MEELRALKRGAVWSSVSYTVVPTEDTECFHFLCFGEVILSMLCDPSINSSDIGLLTSQLNQPFGVMTHWTIGTSDNGYVGLRSASGSNYRVLGLKKKKEKKRRSNVVLSLMLFK